MKPALLVTLTAALAAITAFAVTEFRSSPRAASPSAVVPASTGADDIARLARSIDALQKQGAEMQKGLDDLRMEVAKRTEPAARVPIGDIDAAVARALADRAAKPADAADPAAKAKAAAKKLDPGETYAKLLSGNLSREESDALWKAAREAGILDEVMGQFEQFAKDHPNDPKAQLALGRAYLQKLFGTNPGPEQGQWATKADKQFDKALALDDHDWDARFAKAISLSFWPPIFGKQGEAIQNFETLVQQQEGQSPQPGFAQTYLLLGNMYKTGGDSAKALAAWQKGLALFPDNVELQKQIAGMQGH